MFGRCVLGAAFVLLAIGCSKKPAECHTLIAVIDDDDQKIQQTLGLGAQAAKAAEIQAVASDLATLEDKLAADVGALKLTTPELATLATSYKQFATDVAAAARETASTMADVIAYEPKVDPAKPDGVPQKMRAAADKMTARCTAKKSTECVKLFDKMKKILDLANKVENVEDQAKQIDAFVAELQAATLKDAELKADVDEFAKSMTDASNVLKQAAALRAKTTATKQKLDETLAREKPLTDGVNAICVPQQLRAAPVDAGAN
jgi:methyl-accepting chemotaxis protein